MTVIFNALLATSNDDDVDVAHAHAHVPAPASVAQCLPVTADVTLSPGPARSAQLACHTSNIQRNFSIELNEFLNRVYECRLTNGRAIKHNAASPAATDAVPCTHSFFATPRTPSPKTVNDQFWMQTAFFYQNISNSNRREAYGVVRHPHSLPYLTMVFFFTIIYKPPTWESTAPYLITLADFFHFIISFWVKVFILQDSVMYSYPASCWASKIYVNATN